MGFDWKKTLGAVAPMIGTALGGPLGGAAATTLVAKLGLSKDGKPVDPTNQADFESAMADALLKPEQVVQIKLAEMDFNKSMTELGIKSKEDLLKIAADDRASARAREVSLKDKYVPVLATVIVGSFVATVLAILRGWGRVEAAFAGTLVGYMAAQAQAVVNYYFGSSAGSEDKNQLLYNSTPAGK